MKDGKIKVKTLLEEIDKDDIDDVYVVDEEEVVDACYGMDVFKITLKDIEALKNGKYLYFLENGGEYSAVMFLGEE